MAPQVERRIGSVIDGRYRLLEVLGSGGMGVVYRAEHLLLKQEVALKLLHTHLAAHPRGAELKQRFLREAQSLARLDRRHPHIAPVIDCGVCDDGTLYMAMELLEGEPLCDVIARGPLPPARALHICAQVLRTLVHAHARGIVHRDLKPDNVMLTRREGRQDYVKVLDFGIAKLLSEAEIAPAAATAQEEAELRSPRPAPLTRAGIVFGTPEYLAPEQAQGQAVDQRADLYAVGCVLWEMLVGRRPFLGTSALEVISMHLTAQPPPPSAHAPVPLPPALDEVVLRAMAKDPEARYASAEQFLRALDVVLADLSRGSPSGRVLTPLLGGLRRPATVEQRALPAPAVAAAAASARPVPTLFSRVAARLGVRGAAALAAAALLGGVVTLAAVAARVQRGRAAHASAPTATPQAVRRDRQPPAAPVVAVVPLQDLIDGLDRGRSCTERRSAVLALLARGDPRALPSLERARRAASGRRAPNACIRPELDDAIEKLRLAPRAPGVDSTP